MPDTVDVPDAEPTVETSIRYDPTACAVLVPVAVPTADA